MLPEGFIYKPNMEYRSEITGKLCASKSGLRNYLTNVVYLGHWIHKQVIVEWDNHAPLVDADLFMYAFNRISKSDFHGEPNANHSPYRAYRPRQPKNTRSQPYPTYASLVFSDDIAGMPQRRLSTNWHETSQKYQYNLCTPGGRSRSGKSKCISSLQWLTRCCWNAGKRPPWMSRCGRKH